MTLFSRGSVTAALVCLAALAAAAAPGFWQVSSQADFLKGDLDQLSVDEHGRLMLGPELQRVHDAGQPFVWTIAPGPDGSVFMGTGNDGKVIKVDRAGTASVFFDSGELEIHALAPAPNGGLYVGSSPDGRIYKIDASGTSSTFFDPEDKYIWALAVDAKGVVYAATGDKGVVYRISSDGKGEKYFSTKAAHATALGFDQSGRLLVGTGSPGRVFRIDGANKGFLALDTTYQEVRAIRVTPKGDFYVAAQNARGTQGGDSTGDAAPSPPPTAPVANVSTEITGFAIIDVPVTPQAPGGAGGATGGARASASPIGAIFHVEPDGLWDVLWESRDDAPYDLAVEPNGALVVATGGKGKVFRLSGDPVEAALITRVPGQQATMLLQTADRTLLAASNPGLLLSLSKGRSQRGTYESDVKDARLIASWGALSWRATVPAGAAVELYTRSGNTKTPDDAWSAWAGPYTVASGSAITSPKARYLQWRAVLTGRTESPVLTSVSAAYLQRNARPQVTSITVHPPGVVFQKPFSTGEAEIAGFDAEMPDRKLASQGQPTAAGGPTLGRRIYQKGLQTVAWKADDDNGDDLVYDVLYRREGETTWHPLKTAISEELMVWDTSSMPNGTYVLKVVASDGKVNAADAALRGEMESNSFEVDNTPPVVSIGAARRDGDRIVVALDVRDADSVLTKVEYSIDAQKWQAAYPRDGILDGRQETFDLRFPQEAAGRSLVVRATDALNNVGTGQTPITLPPPR
jgi:sugar lactone lactonase YvrE